MCLELGFQSQAVSRANRLHHKGDAFNLVDNGANRWISRLLLICWHVSRRFQKHKISLGYPVV